MLLPWHHCRCQPCLRGCAQLPGCASNFFPPLASHLLSPAKKTSKAFFHLHDQLTPSISAVSCSAEATKSPKSILVSLSVPALKLETSSPPLFAHRNPNLHFLLLLQLFYGFTLLTAPLQVVPGTLVEEELGLQGTAVPYLRSTAASEYFSELSAFLQKQIIWTSFTCIAYWGLLYMACCCCCCM